MQSHASYRFLKSNTNTSRQNHKAPEAPFPGRLFTCSPTDYCVSKKEIATLIHQLSQNPKPDGNGKGAIVADDKMEKEIAVAAFSAAAIEENDKPGTPSVYGCPDCGGTLWELQDDRWLRFRTWASDRRTVDQAVSSLVKSSRALDTSSTRSITRPISFGGFCLPRTLPRFSLAVQAEFIQPRKMAYLFVPLFILGECSVLLVTDGRKNAKRTGLLLRACRPLNLILANLLL